MAFQIDTLHTASLDVDAQCGFTPLCPQELPVPEGNQIVNELNRQANFASFRIGSKDAHSPHALWLATNDNPTLSPITAENMDVRWPEHCVPGTQGFELIPGLPHPAEYDYFVWKGIEPDMHPYGACYHDLKEKRSTGLIEFLKDKKILTILVGGLATDYCVKNTVLQLRRAGFDVLVNKAACRGIAADTTAAALQLMQEQGAIIISSCNELTATKETHD